MVMPGACCDKAADRECGSARTRERSAWFSRRLHSAPCSAGVHTTRCRPACDRTAIAGSQQKDHFGPPCADSVAHINPPSTRHVPAFCPPTAWRLLEFCLKLAVLADASARLSEAEHRCGAAGRTTPRRAASRRIPPHRLPLTAPPPKRTSTVNTESPINPVARLPTVRVLPKTLFMSRPISTESVFRAVADSTRRRILEILRSGERSPSEIQGSFHFSKPTLSHHLSILRATGIITARRRGQGLRYRLNAPALRQIAAWSARFDRLPVSAGQRTAQSA